MFKGADYKTFEMIIPILVYILELRQLMAWSHFNYYRQQIHVEDEKSMFCSHFD